MEITKNIISIIPQRKGLHCITSYKTYDFLKLMKIARYMNHIPCTYYMHHRFIHMKFMWEFIVQKSGIVPFFISYLFFCDWEETLPCYPHTPQPPQLFSLPLQKKKTYGMCTDMFVALYVHFSCHRNGSVSRRSFCLRSMISQYF